MPTLPEMLDAFTRWLSTTNIGTWLFIIVIIVGGYAVMRTIAKTTFEIIWATLMAIVLTVFALFKMKKPKE